MYVSLAEVEPRLNMQESTLKMMAQPASRDRAILLAQLAGTLAIVAFLPNNIAKTVALLLWWAVSFRRVSARELVMYVVACVFFAAMDIASLKQGIFAFAHPDLFGLPLYEYYMWGFYLLHTKRMIRGTASQPRGIEWAIAVLFAVAFGTIHNPDILLIVTGILLIGWLTLAHQPADLAYFSYMILLGAAIEYTGVWSGQWSYPGQPLGGVPIWFVTLWGGVGMFLRRIVLPFVS